MQLFNHTSGEYIEIDNAKIYFEYIGNKNKPVLLLLHGGFENIENLNPIVPYLLNDFYLIGIDSRGHGKSTLGTCSLTYQRIQEDIEKILEYLKIRTVTILGFSDGGIAAFRIAAEKRIKVEKLIAIGSSWCVEDIIKTEKILKSITMYNVKKYFPENVESYLKLNPEPNLENFTKAVVSMWLDKSESGHPDEKVKNINSHTLVIRGEDDFLVSLESLIRLKKRVKKLSLANIPFAGHIAYNDQPLIVETIIKQFLTN